MLEQHLKFILCNSKTQVIRGIHNENDGLTLGIVVLPQSAVTPLTRHIEDCEVYFVLLEGLNLETYCCSELLLLVLLWLQKVDHGRLA